MRDVYLQLVYLVQLRVQCFIDGWCDHSLIAQFGHSKRITCTSDICYCQSYCTMKAQLKLENDYDFIYIIYIKFWFGLVFM